MSPAPISIASGDVYRELRFTNGTYEFPPALRVSGDASVEAILTGIPFLVMGPLAFGLFAFFLAMKRINRIAALLFAAGIIAFVAAIFDLTQLLLRIKNSAGSIPFLNPLIIAREAALSLSIGLRFLFFWSFIVTRPKVESKNGSTPTESKFESSILTVKDGNHSESWKRWDAIGSALKWGLLAASMAILALQVVWRVFKGINTARISYVVDSVLEVVASAFFVVTLLLDLRLSRSTPKTRLVVPYIAPITALLFNFGIALGNCLCFAFSESPLGRFLQALELYILMLFVLIYAFWYDPAFGAAEASLNRRTVASFIGLPDIRGRHSPLRIPSPPIESNHIRGRHSPFPITPAATNSREPPSSDNKIQRSSSFVDRPMSGASSALFLGRKPRSSIFENQFRVQDDPESGYATEEKSTLNPRSEKRRDPLIPPASQQSHGALGTPRPGFDVSRKPETPQNAPMSTTQSAGNLHPSTGPSHDSKASSYPPTGLSRLSTAASEDSNATITTMQPRSVTPAPGSPVYGLNGVIKELAATTSSPHRPKQQRISRHSTTSFDELLRQQSELDNTIAALRLFTPRNAPTTGLQEGTPFTTNRRIPSSIVHRRSRSLASESVTAPSDLSLSVFPDPPLENGRLRHSRSAHGPTFGDMGLKTDPMPPSAWVPSIHPNLGPLPSTLLSRSISTTDTGARGRRFGEDEGEFLRSARNPRPLISRPLPISREGRGSDVPGAYEHPRPAPPPRRQ